MHPDIFVETVRLEQKRRMDHINQNKWKFEGVSPSHTRRPKRFPFRRA